MPPSNDDIADQFSLLSKLMEIHGENSFKTKTYSIAAYNIERLSVKLEDCDRTQIFSYKGIGDSIGKKIIDVLETGTLPQLQQIIEKTPPGVMDMLSIKGLGPKKIATIWKEMEIETVGELLYACNENRLSLIKGFGEKTQKAIQDAIEFRMANQGSHLFAQIENYAQQLAEKLQQAFPNDKMLLTGEFLRELEIINKLEFITTASLADLNSFLIQEGFTLFSDTDEALVYSSPESVRIQFHLTDEQNFEHRHFVTSSSAAFLERSLELAKSDPGQSAIHFTIPHFLREDPAIFERDFLSEVITVSDIKGLIHCHSDWSDGSHSIPELADACIKKGLEYLVLSDHSKTAFYAKGLSEERVLAQHEFIDELNKKYAPFKIFKSIESDILNDGSLDYTDYILSRFDLVIASVHSNLKMTEEKAMARLLKAIENPYTTILRYRIGARDE